MNWWMQATNLLLVDADEMIHTLSTKHLVHANSEGQYMLSVI